MQKIDMYCANWFSWTAKMGPAVVGGLPHHHVGCHTRNNTCNAASSYIPVYAKLTDGTGNVSKTAYLHFELQNCGSNFPTPNGVANSMLANPSVTLSTNSGLTGGGNVHLHFGLQNCGLKLPYCSRKPEYLMCSQPAERGTAAEFFKGQDAGIKKS
jgi:hypothetical protein